MLDLISHSDLETKNIATTLAKFLLPNMILCLHGNLGAGKTCFTNGIANGLNTKSFVSSPTFTIVNEYNADIPIFHFDLYRINEEDFFEIGGDEYLYKNGITIMEWPENIETILPKERLDIFIEYSNKNRKIKFVPLGNKYETLVNKMKGALSNENFSC